MKLTLFELKKLFYNRFITTLFLLILVLNVFFTASGIDKNVASTPPGKDEYYSFLERTVIAAEAKKEDLIRGGYTEKDFAVSFQIKTITLYTALAETAGERLSESGGWEHLFRDDVQVWLEIALIAILTGYIFIYERKTGGYILYFSSAKGRAPLFRSKLLASVSSSLLVFLSFTATSLLTVLFITGFNGGEAPVQSLRFFMKCPYSLSIAGMTVLKYSIRLSGLILWALVLSFAASLFFNYTAYFSLTSAFAGINYYLAQRSYTSLNAIPKYLNLYSFSAPEEFFQRYYAADTGGVLCDFSLLYLAFSFLLSVVLVFGIQYFCSRMKAVVSSEKRFFPLKKTPEKQVGTQRTVRKTHSFSLFGWEFEKIVSNRILLVLLILIAVAKLVTVFSDRSLYPDANELTYREYMLMLEGTVTDEKLDFIRQENERIRKGLQIFDEENNYAFSGGDLSYAVSENNYAYAHKEAIERVNNYMIKAYYERRESPLPIVYDTGWIKILNKTPDYLLVLASILISSFLFTLEFDDGSSASPGSVIRTTRKGRRKTIRAKILVAFVASISTFLLFDSAEILSVALFIGIPGGSYAAGMVVPLTESYISLKSMLFITAILRVLCVTAVTSIAAFTGHFIKRLLPAQLVSAALIVLPDLLKLPLFSDLLFLSDSQRYFDLINQSLISHSETALLIVQSCLIPIVLYLIVFLSQRESTNVPTVKV